MTRLRGERGQALVVTLLFLGVLLAMAAAVLDVGAWYRQHRQTQLTADAAALAGAQALPQDPGAAVALAVEYGNKNGGGVAPSRINLVGDPVATEITVEAIKPTPGIFTKLFGIDSVDISAKATARVAVPGKARYAAPIAVDYRHPLLSGNGCPCFQQATTLDLEKVGPGAFRLINLDDTHGGTGPSDLADWILRGFDGYMPLNWYFSDPGAKFSSSQIKDAMQMRIGDELLFPVYDDTVAQGSNFEYFVIGWVAFHVTGFTAQGNGGTVTGWFERVIWEGIETSAADEENDFGVRVVQLVE